MSAKSSSAPSKIERIQNAVKQLPSVAAKINAASDDLAKPITKLEASLKKYSLGIPTWVTIKSGGEVPDHWEDELGYTKIDGKWRIAIRSIEGNLQYPEADSYSAWAFNDAPRHLRVEAIEKIPDLLEALISNTTNMTNEIITKSQELGAMADVMEIANKKFGKISSHTEDEG
jgi:hypothetical protein